MTVNDCELRLLFLLASPTRLECVQVLADVCVKAEALMQIDRGLLDVREIARNDNSSDADEIDNDNDNDAEAVDEEAALASTLRHSDLGLNEEEVASPEHEEVPSTPIVSQQPIISQPEQQSSPIMRVPLPNSTLQGRRAVSPSTLSQYFDQTAFTASLRAGKRIHGYVIDEWFTLLHTVRASWISGGDDDTTMGLIDDHEPISASTALRSSKKHRSEQLSTAVTTTAGNEEARVSLMSNNLVRKRRYPTVVALSYLALRLAQRRRHGKESAQAIDVDNAQPSQRNNVVEIIDSNTDSQHEGDNSPPRQSTRSPTATSPSISLKYDDQPNSLTLAGGSSSVPANTFVKTRLTCIELAAAEEIWCPVNVAGEHWIMLCCRRTVSKPDDASETDDNANALMPNVFHFNQRNFKFKVTVYDCLNIADRLKKLKLDENDASSPKSRSALAAEKAAVEKLSNGIDTAISEFCEMIVFFGNGVGENFDTAEGPPMQYIFEHRLSDWRLENGKELPQISTNDCGLHVMFRCLLLALNVKQNNTENMIKYQNRNPRDQLMLRRTEVLQILYTPPYEEREQRLSELIMNVISTLSILGEL
eukprot:GDKK01060204.1.p1 GENE.GDKK01060204.1~~GDKK01060204.1.p1  ORF type:complete len:691 (-),score=70.29 GDKK01060204.1:43-1815(-)